MRQDLVNILDIEALPDHIGLAHDRWPWLDPHSGELTDQRRAGWLRALEELSIASDYRHRYYQWRDLLDADGSRAVEVELSSRMLIGHGNPSSTEVGLTVHHTWGVPMIPGSALKGLVAHYLDAVYGAEDGGNRLGEPADLARGRFSGPTLEGRRIIRGPGEVYRKLLGAPAADTDAHLEGEDIGETRGAVVFHDAMYVPAAATPDRPFAADVLTVHQKDYFNNPAKRRPNDYDSPNPVSFLTVRPGTRFLLALSGHPAWTSFALELLREALTEWGVGGKTAAGYGRIRSDHWQVVCGALEPPPPPSEVDALKAWLAEQAGASTGFALPQRERLAALRMEWLPRLQMLSQAERKEAAAVIRRAINSKKLKSDLTEFIAAFGGPAPGEKP